MNEQRFIYAISDGEFVKVGFAKDVEQRLSELQTSNARQLIVVRCVHVPQWKFSTSCLLDAKNYEKSIHKAMHAFAARGEWFSMTALDVFDDFWRQRHVALDAAAEQVGRPLPKAGNEG